MSQKGKKGEKNNNLQNEIEAYLKQNQILAEMSNEKEEELNKIKNEIEEKNLKAKDLSSEGIFELIVSQLKQSINLQKKITESYSNIEICKEKTKNFYDNSQKLDKDYDELNNYNNTLINKIKEIKQEKEKLIELEKKQTEETITQCEKFKKEYQKKFDEVSTENIMRDNEELKKKLKECEESKQKIKENIDSQKEMKEKQNLDFKTLFEDQIQGKLEAINYQSENFEEENEKIREQIRKERMKFESFNDKMKKFNQNFEKAKKKYTKIMNDMLSIKKENQELKLEKAKKEEEEKKKEEEKKEEEKKFN